MLFVTTREELARYSGADLVDAYRQQCGYTDYAFLYAHILHERGREAVHATFHKLTPGVSRSTLDISAVWEQDGWRCRHLEELAPAV